MSSKQSQARSQLFGANAKDSKAKPEPYTKEQMQLELDRQQQQIAEQDKILDQVLLSMGRIKESAVYINEELDSQNKDLRAMEDDVFRVQNVILLTSILTNRI
jgi:hypothetical protein